MYIDVDKNKATIKGPAHDEPERILEIKLCDDGTVRFEEQCDQYYSTIKTKAGAIAMLNEMIDFISKGEQ